MSTFRGPRPDALRPATTREVNQTLTALQLRRQEDYDALLKYAKEAREIIRQIESENGVDGAFFSPPGADAIPMFEAVGNFLDRPIPGEEPK